MEARLLGSVKIVTDSACDIDPAHLQELGVRVVPLSLHFGGESYFDGFELRGKAFWDKLKSFPGVPKTSQPSVGAFREVFEELTADGSGVVAILLSAALSGTYQAAVLAASGLPDKEIAIINSKTASVGYGLMVLEARDLAESGESFENVRDKAKAMVDRLVTVYSVDTLDYLYRNGRIGRARHYWGSILSLKPILFLDKDGYVSGLTRVRGKSKVIPALIEAAGEKVPFGTHVKLGVSHGDVPDAAAELVAAASRKWKVERLIQTEIGGVIGIHNGPGTLALILLPSRG
jgi:DegV family protein with EDD domain